MNTSTFYGRESNRRALQKELGISDSSDDDVEISDDGSDYIPEEENLREMMELIEDDEQNNQEDVGALTPGNSKDKPNSVPKKSQPKSKQRNRRETPLWKFVSTDQTNLYALQENPNKPLKLNVNELEQFIGTLLAMSMVKLSNSRLYWSNNLQCEMVTEAFSRDLWGQIKSNLHCNDNSQAPKYEIRAEEKDTQDAVKTAWSCIQASGRADPMLVTRKRGALSAKLDTNCKNNVLLNKESTDYTGHYLYSPYASNHANDIVRSNLQTPRRWVITLILFPKNLHRQQLQDLKRRLHKIGVKDQDTRV
ncbi:unnamed protein product [Lepeophtheirus salmonis]|uniref:(salmon louse) hypothetical protein n=1 Tax=Lepeophtheirus salmonis TaxID=72036 RepID=A0A7R8H1G5_LEPSM|nr:unnamed protein product [Lepeophtheirus salmonis]CAF2793915.1 unnamed protein product [Lepeophtheirus salmonis]